MGVYLGAPYRIGPAIVARQGLEIVQGRCPLRGHVTDLLGLVLAHQVLERVDDLVFPAPQR